MLTPRALFAVSELLPIVTKLIVKAIKSLRKAISDVFSFFPP